MDKSQAPQVGLVEHQVQDKRAEDQSQPFSYFYRQFDYYEAVQAAAAGLARTDLKAFDVIAKEMHACPKLTSHLLASAE
ncbi:hypothetical protein ACLOJK_022800 [Asimina triloba]